MRSAIRDTCETIITAVVIFLVLQGSTQNFLIEGSSMEPTLIQNQRLLVNKFIYVQAPFSLFGNENYLFDGPKRGDIVVFHPPSGSKTDFVKRIIGVPGDLIDIDNEFVYVNGKKTEWVDDITSRRRSDGYYPVEVPPGSYYVLGDNRRVSIDSRNWEFVSSNALVGRAWAILWPTSDFQIFG